MSDVLVTGANGFIGSHLVKHLRSFGHLVFETTRKNGDIKKAETWNAFPKVDVVIHLAARSFVPDSWNDIVGFMNCNLTGVIEALNYCKNNNAHLVYLSSYLYGNPLTLPITEAAVISVNNPYALTKKLAEDTCRFYSESFGTKVTILRPFNIFGVGQSQQFLIPYLISQIKSKTELHVKDLEPRRDYLYIDDLVEAIRLTLSYDKVFDIFNIGSGYSYSVQDLINLIQNHSSKNLPVFSDSERRKNEIMDTVADIRKAKEKLGWHPVWNMSDGIKALLDS